MEDGQLKIVISILDLDLRASTVLNSVSFRELSLLETVLDSRS